jgi:molybdenum cofactor cytidylyltransferase
MAAGHSSRMQGDDKLLKKKRKTTMLYDVVSRAISSDVGLVRVILGFNSNRRFQEIRELPAMAHRCSNFSEGLSESIKFGLSKVNPRADAVIISLADMPLVKASDYRRLTEGYDPDNNKEICQSISESGLKGHPTLFGRLFFNEIKLISGDVGGRAIIERYKEVVQEVPTNGNGAIMDIDTISDWVKWQKL